jgi:hypothetical protein
MRICIQEILYNAESVLNLHWKIAKIKRESNVVRTGQVFFEFHNFRGVCSVSRPLLDWSVHKETGSALTHTQLPTHPNITPPPHPASHVINKQSCSLSPGRGGGGIVSKVGITTVYCCKSTKTQQNESTKLCFTQFSKEHTERFHIRFSLTYSIGGHSFTIEYKA